MSKLDKSIIPSLVTLGNLLCGFLAIAYISDGAIYAAAWLIFVGMVFDMLDGKIARLTNSSSDLGAELDSLSDMITFGVVPAFLIKEVLLLYSVPSRTAWLISLPFVCCAAWRLARFNVETEADEESHKYFQGLATPAAAGVIASLVLIHDYFLQVFSTNFYLTTMICSILMLSFLMVSNVRYIHMGIQLLQGSQKRIKLAVGMAILAAITVNPHCLPLVLFAGFVSYAFIIPPAGVVIQKIRN